ncbi:MAG TPA: regulatory signaling modulator protein AmpE [Steroidobacteraceae bacterium]|nr:regulatory signaling modulator protein AmpE [Steroidobacteraceae bacterium]
MNFIAFLVGLGIERLLSARLAIREPGWLLGYVRASLRAVAWRDFTALPLAILCAVLPGILVAALMATTAVAAHGLVYVLLAAVVLFFSLGPRDLHQEVSEYRAAVARGDAAAAARLGAVVLEHDAAQRQGPGLESVAEAVFVQANNRLFGVLFWFAIAGPFGALTFRVTDLMRREAIVGAERADAPADAALVGHLCQRVHGVVAFVPARLLALSYGVAGSFEESFSGWRGYLAAESDHFFDANDRLLVHAGRGALGASWEHATDEAARARAALALTDAAFYVWLAAFALLTLLAWIA